MISVRGFCDLNILNSEKKSDLINTCQAALNLGYQTVAINTVIDEDSLTNKNKKGQKAASQMQDKIPLPANEDVVKTFKGKLDVLHRLTLRIENKLDNKLMQSDNIKKYNILAVVPTSKAAVMYAYSEMDVDLISFDEENILESVKVNRKAYSVALNRGICFELMYVPAIKDETARKNIIQVAHTYHTIGKSKNIIISSGAEIPTHMRSPYDIINLGLLFGLSEEQSKYAISSSCRYLLLRAAGRHFGKTVIITTKNSNVNIKNDLLDEDDNEESDDMMEMKSEEPPLKRLKMDST